MGVCVFRTWALLGRFDGHAGRILLGQYLGPIWFAAIEARELRASPAQPNAESPETAWTAPSRDLTGPLSARSTLVFELQGRRFVADQIFELSTKIVHAE